MFMATADLVVPGLSLKMVLTPLKNTLSIPGAMSTFWLITPSHTCRMSMLSLVQAKSQVMLALTSWKHLRA
jgi:hypothetical protein